MSNFWCCPDWSMDSNPIHHPSPANKMKCFILDYVHFWWSVQASRWTQTPSATLLQTKKWNAHILIMFNFWWFARLVNGLEPYPPLLSSQKKWNAHFWITFTSDDLPGRLMNLNLICHPSPTKKMKCSIFDYVQLLMISQAGQLTQSPSARPLQPIKWNASFWIMFTSYYQPGRLMDSNPICHPSPANKMKCSLLDYIHFGWSARLVDGLKPHSPPLSSQKNEMLIFWLCSTSDDQLGWSMDSNPICYPSPAKKMKCFFLYYVQLLMLARLVNGLKPHPPSLSSQKKWNAHFWITFNFWWLAGLVDGLKPHPPPVSSQKKEILVFVLRWTSDDQPGWLMDSNPICRPSPANKKKCLFLDFVQLLMIGWAGQWTQTQSATPLQPKKWNAHILIMFNFWWLAGLVNGLEPHLPPLSSKKHEMLIFWLCSTSDDQPGCSMDSNPSSTSLLPKNEMVIFGLHSTSNDQLGC